MCGEHADTGQRGYKRIQLSQKDPVQPENALHSHEQRYSLTSDRIAPASPKESQSVTGVYPWGVPSSSHNLQEASARTALCNP